MAATSDLGRRICCADTYHFPAINSPDPVGTGMFHHSTKGRHVQSHHFRGQRAGAFFNALLLPLGYTQRPVVADGGPASLCWHQPGVLLPRFYAYLPFDGQPYSAGNGTMVAFLAPSSQAADEGYASGVAEAGTGDGAPGPRAQYSPGYYGAYLRGPDGNKVHLVCRDDLEMGNAEMQRS